ncbi:hypothetical protein GJR96_15740 [Haloferax sp. MBLA0076]|uniref:Solute-binding protein family 5 domain-containing protein n=1 Tax=Haloferax litoreum TaxID=2666140 RepID=A0A6A8GJ58_9EURY|nr:MULTISPECIES: ABC transporter substrate-binding protein [Haloferax]KAB1190430.1 hypothetical protein Hfx1148_15670 [Haloferax sp. CBA1148]MRX23404.1 hypothetical protein [Haloferax litoreum]
MPIVKNNIEDALDITVEAKPVGISAFLDDVYNDKRTYHYSTWGNSSAPPRLDPTEYLRSMVIDYAGNNGQKNYASYTDCEYSDLVMTGVETGDPEERAQLYEDAMVKFSNDVVTIPMIPRSAFVAYRNDLLNVPDDKLGEMGLDLWNVAALAETTPTNGDRWVFAMQVDFVESLNHLLLTGIRDHTPYAQMLNSQLVYYDENLEFNTQLATNYEVQDDSRRYVFELGDATFHNGDPVDAEAVKFTFELLEENDVALAAKQNYSNIEVVDDKTVVFEFDEPNPGFLTTHLPLWGILHPPTWEGMDDPATFEPDPYVGSGPYQLSSFNKDQTMVLEPYDGHPTYSPQSTIVFQLFNDKSTKLRAFRQGEIQVADELSGSDLINLENQLDDAQFGQTRFAGVGAWQLYASYPQAPGRYSEFGDAIGKCINRQEINQVVFAGYETELLHSLFFTPQHPSFPPEDSLHKFTDSVSGDAEAARQALMDAGWGWDDSGNLRYPAGTDTTPTYPAGEVPSADDFACISADGEYVSG